MLRYFGIKLIAIHV